MSAVWNFVNNASSNILAKIMTQKGTVNNIATNKIFFVS